MPNYPPFTATILAPGVDPFDQAFDAENLRVASNNLAYFFVEQDKITGHLQQSLRGKQTGNGSVLSSYGQFASSNQTIVPVPVSQRAMIEQQLLLFVTQKHIFQKQLELSHEINDKPQTASALFNISFTHFYIGESPRFGWKDI